VLGRHFGRSDVRRVETIGGWWMMERSAKFLSSTLPGGVIRAGYQPRLDMIEATVSRTRRTSSEDRD
jgi:hypothetical protein